MASTEQLVVRTGDEDIFKTHRRKSTPSGKSATLTKAPTPGGSAPYGDNPEELPAVRGKRLLRRSIVFTDANIPKALEGKHLIAHDLDSLQMVVTDSSFKMMSATCSKVVAVIRGLRGSVQAFIYENEDDALSHSFRVYVDAGSCYPVLAHQLYSVECYSDDAKFEILFFAKKTTVAAAPLGVKKKKAARGLRVKELAEMFGGSVSSTSKRSGERKK